MFTSDIESLIQFTTQALYEAGEFPDKETLFKAIREGKLDTVDKILSNEVNLKQFPSYLTQMSFSPIEEAARIGQLDVIKLLHAKFKATLTLNFFKAIRKCPRAESRISILKWLMEEERYKEIDALLTSDHIRAACGVWDEIIIHSKVPDNRGLIPQDYLQMYGYENSLNAQIFELYPSNHVVRTGKLKGKSFPWILTQYAPTYLQALCEWKPSIMGHIDLDAVGLTPSRLNVPAATVAFTLCDDEKLFEFVQQIASYQKTNFLMDVRCALLVTMSNSLSAILLKNAYEQDFCTHANLPPSNCSTCKLLLKQAKNLLNYIIENNPQSIPLDEQILHGRHSGRSLAAFIVINNDVKLLEKIILSSSLLEQQLDHTRGELVNLNEIVTGKNSEVRESLCYMLARYAHFGTIKAIVQYGNNQILNLYEVHHLKVKGRKTLLSLLIDAKQWDLIKILIHHYDWKKSDFASPLFGTYTFEQLLIRHNQQHILATLKTIRASVFSSQKAAPTRVHKVEKQDSTPLVLPRPLETPILNPLETLQLELDKLIKPLGINYALIALKNDVYQLTFTGPEDKIRPLTLIIRKHNLKIAGPVSFQPGLVRSTLDAAKLTVLQTLCTNNKVQKDIKSINDTAKKEPVMTQPFINKASQPRVVKLTQEEQIKWENLLHSAFCKAKEVRVSWCDDHFKITWSSCENSWHVQGPKESHGKFNVAQIDTKFIQEQIVQRLIADFTDTEDGCLLQEQAEINIIPYSRSPSTLHSIHSEVFKQLKNIATVPTTSSAPTLFAPKVAALITPAILSPTAALPAVDQESIRALFFTITENARSLELICEHLKQDKWRISFKQKGMSSFFTKFFPALLKAINSVEADTMEIHEQTSCAIFRCRADKLAILNKHMELLKNLFVFCSNQTATNDASIETDFIITPPKPLPTSPAVDTAADINLSCARADLVKAIKNLNDDSLYLEMLRVNLDTHIQHLIAYQQQYQSIASLPDKEILYYAYLFHLTRLFHILSRLADKDNTILHKWRNILRHAAETKHQEELLAQVHPLVLAIRDLLPNLKANSVTLGEFFVNSVVSNQHLQAFIDGALPYEESLVTQTLGDKSESEKIFLLDKYTKLLHYFKDAHLPDDVKKTARVFIESLIGEQMNKNSLERRTYRAVGHGGLDMPVLDFVGSLIRTLPTSVSDSSEEPTSPLTFKRAP